MSVQIHISGDNANEAVKELSALASHFTATPAPVAPMTAAVPAVAYTAEPTVATPSAPPIPVAAPATPQPAPVPTAPPVAVPTAPPAPPAPAAPAAVPIASQSYSMDQLAVAATALMDAGRHAELIQLLQSFGVPSLTALPKEQYGTFATQLRAMGAKL